MSHFATARYNPSLESPLQPVRPMSHCFKLALLLCLILLIGCSTKPQDTQKTRQQAADAAAQLKQDSKQAVTELKQGAEEARKEGTAIAQGAREGWSRDNTKKIVNVNSASEADLLTLPGFTRKKAIDLIENRPYRNKHDLVAKGVISETDYSRISSRITTE
jgi:DNA uptake protein ComE-like DNA-binding protein